MSTYHHSPTPFRSSTMNASTSQSNISRCSSINQDDVLWAREINLVEREQAVAECEAALVIREQAIAPPTHTQPCIVQNYSLCPGSSFAIHESLPHPVAAPTINMQPWTEQHFFVGPAPSVYHKQPYLLISRTRSTLCVSAWLTTVVPALFATRR